MHTSFILLVTLFFLGACGGGSGGGSETPPPADETATVLAANDLGMHCMDREFSVFSILPPFNVVNAQVVLRDSTGRPYVADADAVDLFYEDVADASGSMNSYSIDKTDFWSHANALFGVNLSEGESLTGLYMPVDDPQVRGPQPMEYSLAKEMFAAEGIPITPTDDLLATNPYPLMRISAVDAQSGAALGHLDVVVPVATETDCRNCHQTGNMAAEGVGWSTHPDVEIQTKINILKRHDMENGTGLETSQPVLCAQCHYSPALDLAGTGPAGDQVGKPNFSRVMHAFHGELEDGGLPVFPPGAPVEDTCYQCHPGGVTQCQRGAMKTGGMDCNDCHGDMLAVGGKDTLLDWRQHRWHQRWERAASLAGPAPLPVLPHRRCGRPPDRHRPGGRSRLALPPATGFCQRRCVRLPVAGAQQAFCREYECPFSLQQGAWRSRLPGLPRQHPRHLAQCDGRRQ
jgi:hypothetical protein